MTHVDDETAVYILEQRTHFEDLRQVAGQLAGWLVLEAAGASSTTADHPLLETAEQLHARATEGLCQARVTVRAQRHHFHVRRAAEAIAISLAAARSTRGRLPGDAGIDAVLIPLRSGYSHLQDAASALPGFEVIGLAAACCALHLPPTRENGMSTPR